MYMYIVYIYICIHTHICIYITDININYKHISINYVQRKKNKSQTYQKFASIYVLCVWIARAQLLVIKNVCQVKQEFNNATNFYYIPENNSIKSGSQEMPVTLNFELHFNTTTTLQWYLQNTE